MGTAAKSATPTLERQNDSSITPRQKSTKNLKAPKTTDLKLSGGRPPKLFVEDCRKVCGPALVEELKRIAYGGEKDGDRIRAMELLMSRGYGQPTQPIHETQGNEAPHDINIIMPKTEVKKS